MAAITAKKWMSLLPDNKQLNEINIPGTHNSAAKNCNFIAKCQNRTLMDQLNYGIRFLDIRCRHIQDRFDLHHGVSYLGIKFDTLQQICKEFLDANPSETIVMSIKPEMKERANKWSFDEVFIKYANQMPGLWYMNENIPILKHVRGKIVLLRRFYTSFLPLGIDLSGWRHNNTFQIKNHELFDFHIQDQYKKPSGQKWDKILQHVNLSISDSNQKTWYLNFCSAHKLPMVPMVIAKDINKKLLAHFKNLMTAYQDTGNYLKLGTIILDFADEAIIKQIFYLNFNCFELEDYDEKISS